MARNPLRNSDEDNARGTLVTEMHVLEICDDIGSCWQELGVVLGVPLQVLSNMNDDSRQCRENSREMLRKWINSKGRSATVNSLVESLESIGNRGVAQKLLVPLRRAQGHKEEVITEATLIKDIPFRLRLKIEDLLDLPDQNHHDWRGMASVMNLNAEEVRRLENARENGKMKGLIERMIQRHQTVNDLLTWLKHPDVQRWDVIDEIRMEPNNISAALLKLEAENSESQLSVPAEIVARGPLALQSYNKALLEGKTCVKRLPVMFIGQARAGKTSLKKSLKGEAFDVNEGSTDGIEVDPAYFKVSTEIWKTGELNQKTCSESEMSFECRAAAQFIMKSLKKEANVMNIPESFVDEEEVAFGPDLEEATETVANGTKYPTKDTTGDTAADYRNLFVPELPEDIATMVEKLLKEGEKKKEDEEIFSVMWDFGGQSVYYSTHPIFLSLKAIYILVCDLSRDPHDKADPLVRKGMFNNKEDTCCNKTNLDYLDFWLSSVYSLSSPDDTCEEAAMSETLPTRLPPVFFVCTHADKPHRITNPRDLALEIYGLLRAKTFQEHLFKDVFVVDNTKSGSKHECSEVRRLRDEILAVAKELPQMKEEIPLKWLRYETALQMLCKNNHKWIQLTEARQLALDVCKIQGDVEFQTLLNFLHDQRILIHFTGTPELERMVILDPQWLIDVFKMVITVKRYEHKDRKVEELWRKLEKTGILDENLLEHVWSSLFDKRETRESLTAIMERFSLLCSWPSNSESTKQYLVPSMLLSPPTDAVLKLLADAVHIPSLYVKFTSGRVPPGLFPRLVLQFFQCCTEEWKTEMIPQLFQNFAMFHICPEQGTAVIFLCHSSFIEVCLHSGNKDPKETADFKNASFDEATTASRTIYANLRLILDGMRTEFSWLKNMSYEMCVCCQVCSPSGTVNYCHNHDTPGCSQDECLHLVPDSELYECQQVFICTRPGVLGNCRIEVKQYAPHWLGFLDDQESGLSLNQEAANDGKERGLFSSECKQLKQASLANPGPSEEKALALPHAVQAALRSESSDAQDIVARLEEDLQLKQVSLKNPDPETNNMIRCLARKAKFSDRLDVVKHLREVVPAGTTGPLLPENLDVQNMPLQQRKDLSVHLCGGDEWMTVAERLGLGPAEILLFEKRSRIPFADALVYIRNQRYLNVGQLYDTVVDCGFPTFADLL